MIMMNRLAGMRSENILGAINDLSLRKSSGNLGESNTLPSQTGLGNFFLGPQWNTLHKTLWNAIETTIYMVTITTVISGIIGLLLGTLLYSSGKGRLLENLPLYWLLNLVINIIRPIPFIILVAALGPVTMRVTGTTIGTEASIFVMIVGASMAIARIVEQNLVTVDPGLIDAARSMGATKFRVIWSVIIPEALGPLILGYTFLTVGIVDMSAMAGMIGGGGMGDFAIQYGYNQFNWHVTLTATIVIILGVQLLQYIGNYYSRRVLRK